MIIPNLQNDQFVQSSLYLSPTWEYWFNTLITELQKNVGTEGFVVSSLSSASTAVTPTTAGGQIDQIEAKSTPGTLVFDTNTNALLCAFQTADPAVSIFRAISATNWTTLTVNTSVTMDINTGYIVTAGSNIDMTLPSSAPVGSLISIIRLGAGDYTVKQPAGVQVQFGNMATTLGIGGSLASMNIGDALTLLCTIEDTTWGVLSSVGNFTIV